MSLEKINDNKSTKTIQENCRFKARTHYYRGSNEDWNTKHRSNSSYNLHHWSYEKGNETDVVILRWDQHSILHSLMERKPNELFYRGMRTGEKLTKEHHLLLKKWAIEKGVMAADDDKDPYKEHIANVGTKKAINLAKHNAGFRLLIGSLYKHKIILNNSKLAFRLASLIKDGEISIEDILTIGKFLNKGQLYSNKEIKALVRMNININGIEEVLTPGILTRCGAILGKTGFYAKKGTPMRDLKNAKRLKYRDFIKIATQKINEYKASTVKRLKEIEMLKAKIARLK